VTVTGAYLRGTAGADTLTGGDGDDYFLGGEGADVLDGGAGADRFADLSADADVDTLTGGGGRDTFYYLPTGADVTGVVADVITDFTAGPGGDVIRLSTSQPDPFQGGGFALVQDGADTLIVRRDDTAGQTVLLRLQNVAAGSLTSDNFAGVAIAADNSDFLQGTDGADQLTGGQYDDRLFGYGGDDTLSGLAGNDKLSGGLGDDTIDGGFGDDLIAGEGGLDVLVGGEGSDVLSGGTGDDTLTGYGDGSSSADSDVFAGGEGDDTLRGGIGNDVYRFDRGDGRDTIADLGGADRLEFGEGIAAADVSVVQDGGDVVLTIAGGGGQVPQTGVAAGGAVENKAIAHRTRWHLKHVHAN
jgi:Ca2+-binding RTX toxin-like protein